MSYCKEDGKDQVIFATKEDMGEPSKAIINIQEDPEDEQPGLILPNGDINWECPCLGGMATGPCGVQFREAFSCFHYSTAEPKGSDCYEAFLTMQECMSNYPELYPASKGPSSGDSPELSELAASKDESFGLDAGDVRDAKAEAEPTRAQS
ncbi:mitochondrial intermembrane space import and assembly protein 40 [Plakobranchus ocellatus]|uniref:Mitochondrial intermembrane space import and assembly protein 40 n=1 Tax=Plakobranchus ocellatus TaxID=259542 RepID=A0AAV3Y195_9GAST|nr:mitochondrial intermembrane space import and assembly protein 40 [Plakobranchus ocellatus]